MWIWVKDQHFLKKPNKLSPRSLAYTRTANNSSLRSLPSHSYHKLPSKTCPFPSSLKPTQKRTLEVFSPCPLRCSLHIFGTIITIRFQFFIGTILSQYGCSYSKRHHSRSLQYPKFHWKSTSNYLISCWKFTDHLGIWIRTSFWNWEVLPQSQHYGQWHILHVLTLASHQHHIRSQDSHMMSNLSFECPCLFVHFLYMSRLVIVWILYLFQRETWVS